MQKNVKKKSFILKSMFFISVLTSVILLSYKNIHEIDIVYFLVVLGLFIRYISVGLYH